MQNFGFHIQHPWGTWLAVIMAKDLEQAQKSAQILYGCKSIVTPLDEQAFSQRAKAGGLDIFYNEGEIAHQHMKLEVKSH